MTKIIGGRLQSFREALKPYQNQLFLKLSAVEYATDSEDSVFDASSDDSFLAENDGGLKPFGIRNKPLLASSQKYGSYVSLASGILGEIDGQEDGRYLPTMELFDWSRVQKNEFGPLALEDKIEDWRRLKLDLEYHHLIQKGSAVLLHDQGMLVRYASPQTLEDRKQHGTIYLGDNESFRNEMSAVVFGKEAIVNLLDIKEYFVDYACLNAPETTGVICNTAEIYLALLTKTYLEQLSKSLPDLGENYLVKLRPVAAKYASGLLDKWAAFTAARNEYYRKRDEHNHRKAERDADRKSRGEHIGPGSRGPEDHYYAEMFRCELSLSPIEATLLNQLDKYVDDKINCFFKTEEQRMFEVVRDTSYMCGLPEM